MKFKTFARLYGALQTGLPGFFAYETYKLISPVFDPSSSELEKKTCLVLLPLNIAVTLISSFLAADGISDIISGKHHYLISKLYLKFSNSEDEKREIREYLKDEEELKNEKIPLPWQNK